MRRPRKLFNSGEAKKVCSYPDFFKFSPFNEDPDTRLSLNTLMDISGISQEESFNSFIVLRAMNTVDSNSSSPPSSLFYFSTSLSRWKKARSSLF